MASVIQTLKSDWSLSASVAGFLAVLISYAGPLIIFFQAAQAAQVSDAMMRLGFGVSPSVLPFLVYIYPLNIKHRLLQHGPHLVPLYWLPYFHR